MRYVGKALLVVAAVLFPVFSYAQELAGVVRDASGGVLPGVTVEAASPALIEKVRTTVTDGTGQYRLTDLRPGTYDVTFTLTGFAVVRREALEVSGAGVITINVELRVGGVQETITVTGEVPVVDVQTSTIKQAVLDDSVIAALPSTRGYGNLLAAVAGIQRTGLDNGTNPGMTFFTAHGGRGNEGTVQIDGMNVGASFNGGGVSEFGYNTSNAAEVQVTVVGGLGDIDRGGPAFNMIPKTGGNMFSGSAFQGWLPILMGLTVALTTSWDREKQQLLGEAAPQVGRPRPVTRTQNGAATAPAQRIPASTPADSPSQVPQTRVRFLGRAPRVPR